MKRWTILALVAGLAVAAVLIVRTGAADVATAAASVGWGLLAVIAARVAVTAVAAAGWWALLRPPGPTLGQSVVIKAIREGVNNLLPVAQVGGEVAGMRLAARCGQSTPAAGAGIAADMSVQTATQFVLTLLALALLAASAGDSPVTRLAFWGIVLSVPLLGLLVLAQGRRGEALMRRVWSFFVPDRDAESHAALEASFAHLRAIYADKARLAASAVLHLLGWLAGVGETWLALYFMGVEVGWREALVIEILGQAVRSAAFVVPGAIGVQEGGFIALCALFGVPADRALALSLIKRAADLAVGLPALAAWPVMEGRRVGTRPSAAGGAE